jgi:hypothetical protein
MQEFTSSSALSSANLSGPDRNVTGVGPGLDCSKARKAALRGSPQPTLRSHSGNPARGSGEGRLKGVRVHQNTSLDTLLEAAILEMVE